MRNWLLSGLVEEADVRDVDAGKSGVGVPSDPNVR
jgi:hypothetical protein